MPLRLCLGGQVLGELDHRGLGDRVGRHLRPPQHAGLAGDVDDPAGAARCHGGQDGPRAQEDAAQVDLDRPPPVAGVDLPGVADRAADARVVDQQADGPELAVQRVDGVRHGLLDR